MEERNEQSWQAGRQASKHAGDSTENGGAQGQRGADT